VAGIELHVKSGIRNKCGIRNEWPERNARDLDLLPVLMMMRMLMRRRSGSIGCTHHLMNKPPKMKISVSSRKRQLNNNLLL
jgi:hypothetical protein